LPNSPVLSASESFFVNEVNLIGFWQGHKAAQHFSRLTFQVDAYQIGILHRGVPTSTGGFPVT
jgi:hypothetical protein